MKTTLCCSLLVALAAFTGASEARSNYIPRTERGQLVANLVERWSPEAAQRMKTTPGAWANAMAGAFAKAPMEALRSAVAASKFEDVIGSLQATVSPASLQEAGLVFHTLTPCRLVDSRKTTKLLAGETRSFWNVPHPSNDFASQGGSYSDCGLPIAGVSALALKVTAVDAAASGYLHVFRSAEALPIDGALDYQRQALDNHSISLAAYSNSLEPMPEPQMSIFTNTDTHVVVDVVGWYGKTPPLNCRRTAEFGAFVIDGSSSTSVNAPACESYETQTATFCRSASKSTVLLGTKDKECVFADATPNGVGGSAYAGSKCCSVEAQ